MSLFFFSKPSETCTDLEDSLLYFTNLWIAAHATWSRAFKIKGYNGTFSQLKNDSTLMLEEFSAAKKTYVPQACDNNLSFLEIFGLLAAAVVLVAMILLLFYCCLYGCKKSRGTRILPNRTRRNYQSIPWLVIKKSMYFIRN